MQSNDIKLSDWQRIIFGEVPPAFYLEVIFRSFFCFALLMIAMRLMGKRMATQLTRIELSAMTSLAAAIGVPILDPQRGILPAVIIAGVVVSIQQYIASRSSADGKFESLTQDNLSTLVEEGVMQLPAMRQTRITRERVFAQLRSSEIDHLGLVKRLYVEANGSFTLVKQPEPRPGLSVIPEWDQEFRHQQPQASGTSVCRNCGWLEPKPIATKIVCGHCGAEDWIGAVK